MSVAVPMPRTMDATPNIKATSSADRTLVAARRDGQPSINARPPAAAIKIDGRHLDQRLGGTQPYAPTRIATRQAISTADLSIVAIRSAGRPSVLPEISVPS